ncbi:MAG: hypothetical protein FJ108_04030 [Deltaproteobacteria bacterium]|nr:hypothetical protein [Deltaproteobacteria bacterium]
MKGSSRFISFGEFLLDCERGVLRRAGEFVDLRPKPLALLIYLAQHRTRAIPKRELLQQLWPDVFVSETALASALKDLRRAIGDNGLRQQVVKTLRRRGYRFAAQVRDRAPDPTAPRGLVHPRVPDHPEPPVFVGRAHELAWLMERLADAAAGRPRVVLVVGEAGIGKSSLVEQLQREPECEDFEVVTGHCQVQASLPYLPFVEALRQWLLQNDESLDSLLGDEPGVIRQLLQPEAGMAGPLPNTEIASGERKRAELFSSIYRVFEKLALRRRIALVIEDLHCADSASLDLLRHFVGAMSDSRSEGTLPLLVVATLRPPASDDRLARAVEDLERESICDRRDLSGLDAVDVRELAGSLGVAALPARAARRITTATRGNPLFVREFIRDGAPRPRRPRAARRGGGASAARATVPVPARLGAALGSRIDRLRVRTRSVLTVAALIGDRFGLLALGAACRMSDGAIAASVAEAVAAGLLAGERRSYRFAHPLVREVLLDATPAAERAEIHGELADVLEDLYASATGEHALEIAHHLVLAGDRVDQKRLLDYARRAADQAFAICAWHDAARFYEAATRATDVQTPAELAELHFRAGIAANRDANRESCRRHYERSAELFARIGDDAGRARVGMLLLRDEITSAGAAYGQPIDRSALMELAMKLSDAQPALGALILETLSEACWTAGDTARAEAYAERALGMGPRIDDDAVCRQAAMGLALARFSLMKVRDAIEGWRDELARGRRARDTWLASAACTRIPLGLLHLGRVDEAAETANEAERLARGAQSLMDLSLVLSQQACLNLARGDFAALESTSRAALLATQRSRYPWGGAADRRRARVRRCAARRLRRGRAGRRRAGHAGRDLRRARAPDAGRGRRVPGADRRASRPRVGRSAAAGKSSEAGSRGGRRHPRARSALRAHRGRAPRRAARAQRRVRAAARARRGERRRSHGRLGAVDPEAARRLRGRGRAQRRGRARLRALDRRVAFRPRARRARARPVRTRATSRQSRNGRRRRERERRPSRSAGHRERPRAPPPGQTGPGVGRIPTTLDRRARRCLDRPSATSRRGASCASSTWC